MPLPVEFEGRLRLPAIAAPMFLTSGPDLVVEVCRSGLIGTFPALNQRTTAQAGIQLEHSARRNAVLDASLRWHDGICAVESRPFCFVVDFFTCSFAGVTRL